MQPVLNNIYHLSGSIFDQEALEVNNHAFKHIRVESGGTWVFEGVVNQRLQICAQQFIDTKEAVLVDIGAIKPKRQKRKKGERNKAPTVNKAKITFLSGESYTVKDFVAIEATAESVVFIMEDNWKGTVNYRQAITVPNDDVDTVVVRGVKDRFELDMALTNMGITILRSDNAEILASELNIKL